MQHKPRSFGKPTIQLTRQQQICNHMSHRKRQPSLEFSFDEDLTSVHWEANYVCLIDLRKSSDGREPLLISWQN
jgi:hypothetical protein